MIMKIFYDVNVGFMGALWNMLIDQTKEDLEYSTSNKARRSLRLWSTCDFSSRRNSL